MRGILSRPVHFICHREAHSTRKLVRITQRFTQDRLNVYLEQKDQFAKQAQPQLPIKENIRAQTARTVAYFLPKGFPESVAGNYTPFAKYAFLGYIASSAGGVLAMQSMLFAVGLGAGSIPLAAALNWVIKDGLGQLGGVIFASIVNNQFDAEPKRWRFISSLALDASSFLELLTPLFPQYFLPIASVANIGKNVSFLAASASRAAINKSFAIHENLADVTAKAGSQTIAASMLGTGLGVMVASQIGTDWNFVATGCLIFSLVNLTCTYVSLTHVVQTTVSLKRFEALVQGFLDHQHLLSPEHISASESLFPMGSNDPLPRLSVGDSIPAVLSNIQELEQAQALLANEKYLLVAKSDSQRTVGKVYLLYRQDATIDDIIRGVFHAYCARCLAHDRGIKPYSLRQILGGKKLDTNCFDIVESSYHYMNTSRQNHSDSLVNEFSKQLLADQRWIVEDMLLEARIARYSIDNISQ